MDTLDSLTTRHSVAPAFLVEPAPEGEALERILAAGASAPDHGRLRPWRFVVIRGEARHRLGEVFAEALRRRDPNPSEDALRQERERPLRAPLIIAVGLRLQPDHPKIPEIEQILSAGAAVQNLLLAAHAQGFGAKWLTGANAYDDYVKAALGFETRDRLVSLVHIGTIEGSPPAVPHADPHEVTIEWQAPLA